MLAEKEQENCMSTIKLFAVIALVASILSMQFKSFKFTASKLRSEMFPIIAMIASALEVVLVFGLMKFSLGGINVMLVLGAALAIAGAVMFKGVSQKTQTAAATLLAFIGIIQVVEALKIV